MNVLILLRSLTCGPVRSSQRSGLAGAIAVGESLPGEGREEL